MSSSIKGLLIKDFNLLKGQKNFFLGILVLWAIVGACNFDPIFLVAYVMMMFSFFTLSTLSYDEYENGAAYLFTLPITRKDYVIEKYLFGFLTSTVPCIVISVIFYVVLAVMGSATDPVEYFVGSAMVLPIAWLILALEIPVQLKFGREKSRIAILIPLGVVAVIVMLGVRLCDAAGIGKPEIIDQISNVNGGMILAIAAVVFVVLLWISYTISCRIVEKKQF